MAATPDGGNTRYAVGFDEGSWIMPSALKCQHEITLSVAGKGDPRFHALLADLGRLHDAKQADYGAEGDPFANVRGSNEWGVRPWVGAMVRATDKVRRLQRFAKRGSLVNEGVEDSLMDLAVYALIALILFREEEQKNA